MLKGFIFVNNWNIHETYLKNRRLYLTRKEQLYLQITLESYFTKVEALLDTRVKLIALTLIL